VRVLSLRPVVVVVASMFALTAFASLNFGGAGGDSSSAGDPELCRRHNFRTHVCGHRDDFTGWAKTWGWAYRLRFCVDCSFGVRCMGRRLLHRAGMSVETAVAVLPPGAGAAAERARHRVRLRSCRGHCPAYSDKTAPTSGAWPSTATGGSRNCRAAGAGAATVNIAGVGFALMTRMSCYSVSDFQYGDAPSLGITWVQRRLCNVC
jgi:hypothetical protein